MSEMIKREVRAEVYAKIAESNKNHAGKVGKMMEWTDNNVDDANLRERAADGLTDVCIYMYNDAEIPPHQDPS